MAEKSLQNIQDFDRSSEKYDSRADYRHLWTRAAAFPVHEIGDSGEKRLPEMFAIGAKFSRYKMVRSYFVV